MSSETDKLYLEFSQQLIPQLCMYCSTSSSKSCGAGDSIRSSILNNNILQLTEF